MLIKTLVQKVNREFNILQQQELYYFTNDKIPALARIFARVDVFIIHSKNSLPRYVAIHKLKLNKYPENYILEQLKKNQKRSLIKSINCSEDKLAIKIVLYVN